jgi:hypothetical protein
MNNQNGSSKDRYFRDSIIRLHAGLTATRRPGMHMHTLCCIESHALEREYISQKTGEPR